MKLNDLKVNINQLLLDPNNYRLDYESDGKKYDGDEIIQVQEQTQRRLEKERLGELRDSMIQNGFLEMDRIVVRSHKGEGSKQFVVVEGNRRTAAFKGLLDDYKEGLVDLPEDLIAKASSIGVICVDGSDDEIEEFSSSLMGIRHVSGPKKWTGYQSARLINDRVNAGRTLTEIGALLGISAIDAGRRMRGYRAYMQMKKDKKYGKLTKTKHYTLLLEFLVPGKIGREWLEWDDKKYLFTNKTNRNYLYSAITSSLSSRAEINNPTDARYFIKYLSSDNHRKLIESGEQLSDLPPLTRNNVTKEAPLNNFLFFISDMDYDDLTLAEIEWLKKIDTCLHNILNDEGDAE